MGDDLGSRSVTGDPAVWVDGVGFAYPDGHPALDEVNLQIAAGERVALLGPNGAGKTTLALHLNGILSPSRGSVRISGMPVTKPNLAEIRRRVGIVFQDPDDQLFMPTVRDDVAFGPRNLGLPPDEVEQRVSSALTQVQLLEFADRPPHHLSFGQRRRAAVATVLAMQPDVLVLDEPSSNLDPAARRELAEVLDQLDVTVLMITHDLPYALQLCPRALILAGGRIQADGSTAEMLSDADLLAAHRLELPYGFSVPAGSAWTSGVGRPGS
jgi:cobalt/nickel transport system ATP-binding protein